MDEMPEESQQFEQVLSRLDALMKRSQVAAAVPSGAMGADQVLPIQDAPGFVVEQQVTVQAPADDAIPVLTEVYEGEIGMPVPTAPARDPIATMADSVVEALMSHLGEVLERVLDEEMDKLKPALASRLQAEAAAAIRRRLLPDDYTEM